MEKVKRNKCKDKRAEKNNIDVNELIPIKRKIDGINTASLDLGFVTEK